MSVTITGAQRDAIYRTVITHLTGIGDVWSAVQQRDFAAARQLGREFGEDLRLLEDLGWGESIDSETVTLTMPTAELANVVARLQGRVSGSLEAYVRRPRDAEEIAEGDLATSRVCA